MISRRFFYRSRARICQHRCAAEITKGNGIIARLQRDLAALHTKLDTRSSVVVRQEQEIGDLEKVCGREWHGFGHQLISFQ